MPEKSSEPWEERLKEKMDELDKKIKEIDELKETLRREAAEAKAKEAEETRRRFVVKAPGVRIKVGDDEIEPGLEITKDLAGMIRDSIRRSFAQIGEDTLGDIIDRMPEEPASVAMRSVSTPDRVKILKFLYNGARSYGEIAKVFPEDYAKSSLQHHLQKLRNVRLIERDEVSGNYDLTSRGRSLLRLIAVFYGALRGGELEES